jgi:DNA-binding CsgD family transcriptional regulator
MTTTRQAGDGLPPEVHECMPWRTRLVQRSSEVSGIEAELRRASRGEFRCVALLADPGVGKTRLAAEVLERNRRRTIGLSARAYPLGRTAPFGVWAEALDRHLRSLPGEEVAALCGGFLDDLATLLRSVVATRGSLPEIELPRFRMFEALAVLVANLARKAPVIVFLDDMHFADASSWEVLKYVARNLPTARVLVIAAARPVELADDDLGSEVLLGLEQEDVLRRLPISPLERAGVLELAEAVLDRQAPGQLADWLEKRSGGNPLFILGLLQALVEEGADLTAPELRYIPESLAERVTSRLRLLDEPTIATLEILAVLGRAVDVGELVTLSDRPLERLGEILRILVRVRLVTEIERGRDLLYEIAHPLIQESIYQGIGGARRRALHRLAGRALLRGGRLGEAAPHFARSAGVGDAEAIRALADAVREAEGAEAYLEGLAILDALVDLLPQGDPRWLDVLDAMSWNAEWVVDHRPGAQAALGIRAMRAIDALLEDSGDASRRARVKFRLTSFLAWGGGELSEAERTCHQSLELFEAAGDHHGALLAETELAWIHGLAGDLRAMELQLKRVLDSARATGKPLVQMRANYALAFAKFLRGRFDEAEALIDSSTAFARAEGRAYRLTMSLVGTAWPLAFAGRVEEALTILEKAKRADEGWRETNLVPGEMIVNWTAGNFQTAIERARDAMPAVAGMGSRRAGQGMTFAALSALELGMTAEAKKFVAAARAVFGDRSWFGFSEWCAYCEALLWLHEGREDKALAELQRVARRMLAMGVELTAPFVLLDVAEVAANLGTAAAAGEASARLASIAQRINRPLYLGLSAMSQAWARLASGDTSGGAAAAEEAIEVLSETGSRVYVGRAKQVLGMSLSQVNRTRALETLREAAADFDACRAQWRRDKVRDVLGGLGPAGRKMAAAVRGPSSLTAREREVARLAAQGITAQDIAGRLVLSRRTVESHLGNAYAKLGISSKFELIQRASELGL